MSRWPTRPAASSSARAVRRSQRLWRTARSSAGITRWTAEGHPIQKDIPTFPRTNFTAKPHHEWVVDQAAVERHKRERLEALVVRAEPAREQDHRQWK